MKNKKLFIAGTHGDEQIGIEALQEIEDDNDIDWIIGNEKAVAQNKRFLDCDINRIAPGNPNSDKYEERRAFELLEKAKSYDFVIDIHGTTANSGVFTIVTNPTPQNLFLAASLPIKNIVIWVAKKEETINPLSEYFDCGLEIECGPKNSRQIKEELKKILKQVLDSDLCATLENFKAKNFFQVYDRLDGKEKDNYIKDFAKTTINDEEFYPLLVNQYDGTVCYKMKKINWVELFSY